MAIPQEVWTEDDFCGCGALLDADGKCPYCTASMVGRICNCGALLLAHESECCSSCLNAEYWAEFELTDIEDEE